MLKFQIICGYAWYRYAYEVDIFLVIFVWGVGKGELHVDARAEPM